MEFTSNNLINCQRVIAVVLLLPFLNKVSALKCYQCVEQPKTNETDLSCFYFDESHKFHTECSQSTYCMKKTSHYQLHNGSYIKISVHKCADQSQKTMVQDKQGDWRWTNLIQGDIYKRGCYRHGSNGMLTTEAVNCFCETDLCNFSSDVHSLFSFTTFLASVFVTTFLVV